MTLTEDIAEALKDSLISRSPKRGSHHIVIDPLLIVLAPRIAEALDAALENSMEFHDFKDHCDDCKAQYDTACAAFLKTLRGTDDR